MSRILDYLGVLAFQTTAMTMLVWVSVEQGFSWLDFVFAMSGAALLTSMLPVLSYAAPKLGWSIPIRLPSGFWPTLLILLPVMLAVSAVPIAAIYVLHHDEFRSRTVMEALVLGLGIVVSVACTSSLRRGLETPISDNPKNSAPKA